MKIDDEAREGVILSFEGKICQDVIEEICSFLRRNLDSDNRYLTLFIEQAQNILRYSSQKSRGIILVGIEDGSIYVMSGNPIEKEKEPQLREKLEQLARETKEELRRQFKEQLHRGRKRNKGAGLGLIDIFRKSDRVEYDFAPLKNGETFFTLKAEYGS